VARWERLDVVPVQIIRLEENWYILLTGEGGRQCLPGLALRCGYRIDEMCVELGISQRYFYEVCRRDIGLAPKNWLRRERMVVARRMITGGQSPEEVAVRLGFSSPNNFRREFLAHQQMSPSDFQRRRWGENDDPALYQTW
jgi:AraC-like DNA-binding protein